MNKYGLYNYTIKIDNDARWTYTILQETDYDGRYCDIESDEWFDSIEHAIASSESHIDRLENGER